MGCTFLGLSPVLWLANSTHVVGSNIISSNILDGNAVKAMQGSISATNSGSIWKFRKRWVVKWGTSTKKNIFQKELYFLGQLGQYQKLTLALSLIKIFLNSSLFWYVYLRLHSADGSWGIMIFKNIRCDKELHLMY